MSLGKSWSVKSHSGLLGTSPGFAKPKASGVYEERREGSINPLGWENELVRGMNPYSSTKSSRFERGWLQGSAGR